MWNIGRAKQLQFEEDALYLGRARILLLNHRGNLQHPNKPELPTLIEYIYMLLVDLDRLLLRRLQPPGSSSRHAPLACHA